MKITRTRASIMKAERESYSAGLIRRAEEAVLVAFNDLLVYVIDPAVYDAQPFLGWDNRELTALLDFKGKIVIDVGAGTGRLSLAAAGQLARVVYAIEPVENLRRYLKEKAGASNIANLYPVDGLITEIPFEDRFADIVMGGHVFGDDPPAEYRELARVCKPGGMIVICPGGVDEDNEVHHYLVSQDFSWSRFEEPEDGWRRKYWKQL